MKRKIAFQVALGRSNASITRRLQLPYPVRKYLAEPEMEELVLTIPQELDRRAEFATRELYPMSVQTMRRRLRGKPIRHPKTKKVVGYELPDLKTIELLWRSMGRLSNGNESRGDGQTTINAPSMINDREDAVAAMQLIAERRREIEKRKMIETSVIEVGSA